MFRSAAISFSQEVDACVLVFDVTSVASFENMNSWHKEFLEQTKSNHPHEFPFIVLANKVDLKDRTVWK